MKQRLLMLALLAAGAMFAQYGGYRSSDPYGRAYNNDYRNRYGNAQRSIDMIQGDLSRIGQRAAWDRWAVKQFTEAVSNLERFQFEMSRGRFDRAKLDHAIHNLNRLLTAPELHPADKQRIAAHRDQLLFIRSRNG